MSKNTKLKQPKRQRRMRSISWRGTTKRTDAVAQLEDTRLLADAV